MKLQCEVFDEYFQGMVGDKHLRADGLGKQWKFYLIKEPATEKEKVQQTEEVTKSWTGLTTSVPYNNKWCQ